MLGTIKSLAVPGALAAFGARGGAFVASKVHSSVIAETAGQIVGAIGGLWLARKFVK